MTVIGSQSNRSNFNFVATEKAGESLDNIERLGQYG